MLYATKLYFCVRIKNIVKLNIKNNNFKVANLIEFYTNRLHQNPDYVDVIWNQNNLTQYGYIDNEVPKGNYNYVKRLNDLF